MREINKFPWRSYADEKLGYELKYPPSWSIADERQNSGVELARVVFQSKDYQEIESEEYKRIVAAGEETGLLQPTVMSEGIELELLITEIPSGFKWQDWARRATDYPYGEIVSQDFTTIGDKEVHEQRLKSGEVITSVVSFPDPGGTKLFELMLYTLKKNAKDPEILLPIVRKLTFNQ